MKHLVSDLRFRIELNNDCVVSGSKTDFKLDQLNLFITSPQEADFDKSSRTSRQRGNAHKYIFLDAERLTYNDKTLTSQAETRWNLDQFVGKAPFLLVVIKPNTAPNATDKSLWNYLEVGEDATFDLENSSGRYIIGNGTPIKEVEVVTNFTQVTENFPLRGAYVVDFSDNIKKSLARVINGIHQFTGQNDYLRIEFGSAPVAEVQTVSTSLPNAGLAATTYDPFTIQVVTDQGIMSATSASVTNASKSNLVALI